MSWVKILEAQRGNESIQSSQGRKTLKTKVKEMKSWQNNQSWNNTGSKKSNSTRGSLQINWTQSVTELSPKMFWGISWWDELFPPALCCWSHVAPGHQPELTGTGSTSPWLWQCPVLLGEQLWAVSVSPVQRCFTAWLHWPPDLNHTADSILFA